jgi:hypothetical protein
MRQRPRAVNGNVLPPFRRRKSSHVRRLLTCLVLIAASGCAENRLRTYMLIQNPGAETAKKDKKRGEIELFPKPLRLTMIAPEAEELENLAEDLKLAAPSKYHRLPPLTFLRFEFENHTALHWKLDLMGAYFTEPNGKTYRAVTQKDYAARFTSVAYDHFRYDAMYAGYITRHDNIAPKESFWFEKKLPQEKLEIRRGDAGFQIIPFEFIPAGVENLTFRYPVDEKNFRELKIRLYTERGS